MAPKVGGTLVLAFLASILLLAIIGVVSYRAVGTLISNNESVVHTQEVLEQVEGIHTMLLQVETDARGYLLTGIDVYKPVIDFLQAEVSDPRFKFAWWNVQNDQYNPEGMPIENEQGLPVAGQFGIIWLFSVFTHLFPGDSLTLLKIMRNYIRDDGALVFTAFVGEDVAEFENRLPLPEIYACYGEAYMKSLLKAAGWRLESLQPPNIARHVQNLLVCRPG
jgi:hypothetical protein